jgi:lysine-N-methylase
MIIEYPDYYEKFKCVGGDCKDTCCAGWEIDIDEETFYYYQTLNGDIGNRIKESIKIEGEDVFFPLTKNNRCPFLNDKNLCDIYSALGEESLCQVCTEYPRYYLRLQEYEQIDMSLSCMELGRIFFENDEKICFIKRGSGHIDDEVKNILSIRNEMIDILQGEGYSIISKWQTIFSKFQISYHQESAESLINVFENLELIDEKWRSRFNSVKRYVAIKDNLLKMDNEEFYKKYGWQFEKLSVYFVFRYISQIYYSEENLKDILNMTIKMIIRSLSFIKLMIMSCDKDIDIIDITHAFSKQVEHSDENVEKLML